MSDYDIMNDTLIWLLMLIDKSSDPGIQAIQQGAFCPLLSMVHEPVLVKVLLIRPALTHFARPNQREKLAR